MNSPAPFRAPFPLLQTFSVTIGGNTFYATQAPPHILGGKWAYRSCQVLLGDFGGLSCHSGPKHDLYISDPRSSDNSLEQPHDSSQGTIIAPSFPSLEELSANRRSESKHRGVRGGPSTHVRNKNKIMIPKDIKNCRGGNEPEFRRNFRSLMDWNKPPRISLIETKMENHQELVDDFPFNRMIQVLAVRNSGGMVVLWDDTR
ncbi:hypothetical protein KY284_001074 [Solanum tuberosum]|nr:hypothetical protein KY284_001074 [Solanum tuberosum]